MTRYFEGKGLTAADYSRRRSPDPYPLLFGESIGDRLFASLPSTTAAERADKRIERAMKRKSKKGK